MKNFDTFFLKHDNKKENKLYSPLSIKYALEMIQEISNGDTKEQVLNILGTYNVRQYRNSKNLSICNSLFIKNSYINNIKTECVSRLKNNYNADVIFDSFVVPDKLNNWVKEKSFNMIDNMFADVSDDNFILINVVAIDMAWKNQIENFNFSYENICPHINAFNGLPSFRGINRYKLAFKGFSKEAKFLNVDALINRYDIIKDLGEEKIRNIVGEDYEQRLKERGEDINLDEKETYLNRYIKEIDSIGHVGSSTDFEFYIDSNVKMFAKDLKEYDGTNLQYVGIMPINQELDDYISNIKDLNGLIANLKEIKLENFKDGVVTNIVGKIPLFKFDYKKELKENIEKLGIIDAFNVNKADFSNLTLEPSVIDKVKHKTMIEFSNEGIKAAAATAMMGIMGAAFYNYDYFFDVPVETIDLTFDNPFMFLIRDKVTNEIWFIGTVYEPLEQVADDKF